MGLKLRGAISERAYKGHFTVFVRFSNFKPVDFLLMVQELLEE